MAPRGTFASMDSVGPRATPPSYRTRADFRVRSGHLLLPAPHACKGAGFLRFCSELDLVDQACHVPYSDVLIGRDVATLARHLELSNGDRPLFRALSNLFQLSVASVRRPIRCPGCRPRIGHPAPVRIDSSYSAAPLPYYAVLRGVLRVHLRFRQGSLS